ncbi:hypothetical protein Trydic_g18016 [Trypoxylus dichotomus]
MTLNRQSRTDNEDAPFVFATIANYQNVAPYAPAPMHSTKAKALPRPYGNLLKEKGIGQPTFYLYCFCSHRFQRIIPPYKPERDGRPDLIIVLRKSTLPYKLWLLACFQ